VILFVTGIYYINKHDEETVIKVSLKEYVTMGLIFVATQVGLFSCYGYGREFGCHSLLLYYLTFAAYIDYKTRKVYRIGSIGFIFISLLLFFVVKDMSLYEKTERILWIMVFSIISIMQGTLGWTGWGDVFTYIGVFLSLGTWQYSCMTIEALAVYMLFANLIFLISNIRKFNWKRLRMKTDSAFLPAMAGAMLVMEVLLQYLQKI
jgi:hypothetical protein